MKFSRRVVLAKDTALATVRPRHAAALSYCWLDCFTLRSGVEFAEILSASFLEILGGFMRRIGLFISAILLATIGIAFAQQTQHKPKEGQAAEPAPTPIPATDAAKKNPVKPTPEGLAEARKLYGYHCAMCHGKDGDGKGDLAEQMKLDLKDWRDSSSISKYTDGELFYIITNGRGKMVGGEGDRTKDEVRWNLVSLVRAFGQKTSASTPKS